MSEFYEHRTCKHCQMPIVKTKSMWTHIYTGNMQCQPTVAEPEEDEKDAVRTAS